MKTLGIHWLLVLGLGAIAPAGRAQMLGGPQAGLNAAMTKLFGEFTAFSAKAEVRMLDRGDKESMRVPMKFALLEGKVCAEVTMTEMKSAQMPAAALANLKQMGMDQMTTIVRPDLKSTFVVYPALKAYATLAMSNNDVNEMQAKYDVAKTPLGKETIEGKLCEKSKVIVTSDKGEKREALVWYATELKGFPVQIRMAEGDATMVMLFRDVQFQKPEASTFEAPQGFTKHGSIEQLMQAAMMKMLGGGN